MEKYEEGRRSIKGMLINCTFGAVFGLALALLLLYVFAVLMEKELLPVGLQTEMVVAAAFIGATCGAVISVKRQRKGVMQTGLCTGIFFIVLVFVISALTVNGHLFSGMTLKIIICGITGGVFGGALCLRQSKRKHPKRGRRYTKRNHTT